MHATIYGASAQFEMLIVLILTPELAHTENLWIIPNFKCTPKNSKPNHAAIKIAKLELNIAIQATEEKSRLNEDCMPALILPLVEPVSEPILRQSRKSPFHTTLLYPGWRRWEQSSLYWPFCQSQRPCPGGSPSGDRPWLTMLAAKVASTCPNSRKSTRFATSATRCTRKLKFTSFAGDQLLSLATFVGKLTQPLRTFSRANCFGTKIFYGCMEALLVKDEMRSEMASLLEDAHAGYYDPQSKKKK